MTENQGIPWAHSLPGALFVAVIASVIGSVVGSIVGVAVSNPPTPGVETPVDLTPSLPWIIAGGTAGLVVASMVFKRVRSAIWGRLGRLLRWLAGVWPTTRKQRDALVELGYVRREKEQQQIDAKRAALAETTSEQAQALIQKIIEKPMLPAPRPRWIVQRVNGEQTMVVIRNAVDRSIAREVRLESEYFQFLDGAHWSDLSGVAEGHFSGNVRSERNMTAIAFVVNWYDSKGEPQSETVWMRLDDGWAPF